MSRAKLSSAASGRSTSWWSRANARLCPAALIEQLPQLKLVVTAGMRNLGIDLAACREHGVLVCGTGSGSSPTAELAWGLILALARHIPQEDRSLREGKWQTTIGIGLQGKTLAVLGLGRLGSQVARVGLAFGMKVIAWSQNLTADSAAAVGAVRVEKADLFRMADVLTIHLLLSDRTRGIVGRDELSLMKPGAFLVNTARAAIVDEQALVDALKVGRSRARAWTSSDANPCPPMRPSSARPTRCSRRIWVMSPARPTMFTSRKRSKTSKPGSPANPSG